MKQDLTEIDMEQEVFKQFENAISSLNIEL